MQTPNLQRQAVMHVIPVETMQQGSKRASKMYNLPTSDWALGRDRHFWQRKSDAQTQT